MTGVRASMVPKISPARRASGRRGLRIAAPLPTAAANASVDIAMPMRKMESGDIQVPDGLGDDGTPARPTFRCAGGRWSRQPGLAAHATARSGAEHVGAGAPGRGPEAGYSPRVRGG